MAAVLACGTTALLSGWAAALHWRIWDRDIPGRIDILATHDVREFANVVTHRTRRIHRAERATYLNIPVTSPARTFLELGDVMTPYQLTHVLHQAERRNRFSKYRIERVIERARGRKAVTVLRRALALYGSGSAGTRSWLEDEYLAALASHNAPECWLNRRVTFGERTFELDLYWPDRLLNVEIDGASGHSRTPDVLSDADRDAHLNLHGVTVLRCAPDEIREHAQYVAGLLGATSGRGCRGAW